MSRDGTTNFLYVYSNFLYVYQGGRKRAAHAADWARARAAVVAWPVHAGSPSAGVEQRGRAAATTGEAVRCEGEEIRPAADRHGLGDAEQVPAHGRRARYGRRAPGAAARMVSGPSLHRQGRLVSQATAITRQPWTVEP